MTIPLNILGMMWLLTQLCFRQRLLNANTTPFSLAQKHLPRELLQSVRFGAPTKLKRRKRARLDTIREEEE